jgi:hypothetical protein
MLYQGSIHYPVGKLVTVYCILVRPILEYAAPVWSAIPDYLKDKVERVQKRALKIIDPGSSYEESLQKAGLKRWLKDAKRFVKSSPKTINRLVRLKNSSITTALW